MKNLGHLVSKSSCRVLIYFLLVALLANANAKQQATSSNNLNNHNNKNAPKQPDSIPIVDATTSNANIDHRQSQPAQPTQPGADDEYLIGVGIADITGPSADINLMGYAKPNQDAGGIHLRQYSRSIIVEDKLGFRLMYINLDNGMISQLLRTRVLQRLKVEFGEQTYNESNVMLSATHTHSCPGGFFQYMLYNIPSAGFISQTLDALTDGILRSVSRAHNSLQPGRIYLAKGEITDASVNRSPTSYANNPADERARFQHDTDKTMTVLRLVDRQNQPLAMMNWFAVHGTSMNNSNHLISSDNKGYAAILMEEEFNRPRPLPGQGKFVAIFAQANEGDVSPNTRGPRCIDTGLPCDDATSTCGTPPRNEKCIASGPGRDMFESTKIIAYKQYYKARQLFLDTANQVQVRGPVRYVHEHIDMTKQQVPLYESIVELSKRAEQLKQQQQLREQQQQLQKTQLLRPVRLVRSNNGDGAIQEALELPPALRQPIVPHVPPTVVPAPIPLNATYQTCLPGLGYSFAAGTTDGPGAFDFQQGDTVSTRYWNMVRDFLKRPTPEQMKCHHPKPILLSTGEMDFPYMWHPKVVPTQILMIGQVAIVGLPGEFTTMAGRRVRSAVKKMLTDNQQARQLDFSSYQMLGVGTGDDELLDDQEDDDLLEEQDSVRFVSNNNRKSNKTRTNDSFGNAETRVSGSSSAKRVQRQVVENKPEIEVILSGLSNIYTSYITTVEEYEMQRYEGASTLYGPHTLQAYVNQFKRLASFLVPGQGGNVPIDDSLQPPDLSKSLFTLKAGVIYDGAPHGKNFGDLLQDVQANRTYKCRDQVNAVFVAGNPRNDLKQEQSFLFVERFDNKTKGWQVVATDASWETKFIWERTNTLFGESKATCQWDIPDQCQTGVYRIRHFGAHKSLLQTISQYSGKSSPFKVSGNDQSSSADVLQLELILRSAEQVEALQSEDSLKLNSATDEGAMRAVSATPKSDRQLSSIFTAPFKYLGSLTRNWRF